MPYVPFNFPLTKGYEPSLSPLRSDMGSFTKMRNIRQRRAVRGVLETTPRFKLANTLSQGTYNLTGGANSTESASAVVGYVSDTIIITSQTLRLLSGLQQICIEQVAVPTGDGVTKGCLLEIVDPTLLSVTLGQTYNVEIDGATTFRWRVNGGAWTSLVAINLADGNLIDGGAVRLYWLAASGFTVTDTWTWRRTDYSNFSGYAVRAENQTYYTGSVDTFGYTGRVYVVRYYPSSALVAMRSVGYRPVYAERLVIFENHLFCLGLKESLNEQGGSWLRCSDVGNFDNFIATDTNEADVFQIALFDKSTTLTSLRVLDGAVLQSRLFLQTSVGIYYTDYLGLPTPFSFKFLSSVPAPVPSDGIMAETPVGIVIATSTCVYLFDGARVQELFKLASFDVTTVYHIVYYPSANEILFLVSTSVLGKVMLVFQIDFGCFYIRNVPNDAGFRLNPVESSIYMGGALRVFQDVPSFSASSGDLVYDSPGASAYADVVLETQAFGGETLSVVKETGPVYIAADTSVSSTNGSAYSKTTGIVFTVRFVDYSNGSEGTATSLGTWISSAADGLVQSVRTRYRAGALRLTLTGSDLSKPPGLVYVNGLETSVYVTQQSLPTR